MYLLTFLFLGFGLFNFVFFFRTTMFELKALDYQQSLVMEVNFLTTGTTLHSLFSNRDWLVLTKLQCSSKYINPSLVNFLVSWKCGVFIGNVVRKCGEG